MSQMTFASRLGIGLIAVALSLLATSPASASKWAREMFEQMDHDFGTVISGSETKFVFEFTNKYKETVHIQSVRSTCGCTIPSVIADTVKSREKGGVVATFNTKAFTGSRSAKVTVTFDRPFFAEVELLVRGNILGDVSFEPERVSFGQIASGDTPTQNVQVKFANRPSLRIQDVRSECSDLSVKLGTPKYTGNQLVYDLAVTLKDSMPPGEIRESLTLVTNSPTVTNIPLPIQGSVRPALDVKPASLHFGPHTLGDEDSKRITLRAAKPFEVTNVSCPDERFSFEVVNEKASKFHFIKIVFAASGEQCGDFECPIKIETNLGDTISATCNVTGVVKPAESKDSADDKP